MKKLTKKEQAMTDTKFDIEKAAKIIINKMNKEELTKQEQKNEALKAYNAIQAPAWESYKAIRNPALETYNAIASPAMEAYIAIQAPALKAYLAKCDEIEQQKDDDIRIIDGKRYKLIEV